LLSLPLGAQLIEVEKQFIDAERQREEWTRQFENKEISIVQYTKLNEKLDKEMGELTETHENMLAEQARNESDYAVIQEESNQKKTALLKEQENGIREFAAQHHLSFDEMMADMEENNLTFAEWQSENEKALAKGQTSIKEFAKKWGYSTDEVNAAITNSGMDIDEYVKEQDDALESAKKAITEFSDKWGYSAADISAAAASSGMSIEEYVEWQDKSLEHAQETIEEYAASVTSGFSVMEQESAISINKFMENMKANEAAAKNWAENMNVLMDLGVNQGVINQLAEMGPEGAKQAQAFINELTNLNNGVELSLGNTSDAVAGKLKEIDATFDASLETTQYAADTKLRAEGYYNAGYASIDKIAAGVSENTALEVSVTETLEKAETVAETVDFTAVGQSIIDDISLSLRSGDGKMTAAVAGISESAQKSFNNMSGKLKDITSKAMTDVASAVKTGGGKVENNTKGMSTSVQNALKLMSTQSKLTVTNMIALNVRIV